MFRAHSPHPPPIVKSNARGARERRRESGGRGNRHLAVLSRVLVRLASAAQIGELARRLISRYRFEKPVFWEKENDRSAVFGQKYLTVNDPFSKKKKNFETWTENKKKLVEWKAFIDSVGILGGFSGCLCFLGEEG